MMQDIWSQNIMETKRQKRRARKIAMIAIQNNQDR
jgi:hypothetical protein